MRDVRERARVHESRLALEGLHEVRLDRVLQEDGHRTRDLELFGGHRSALERRRDGDRAQAVPEIVAVAGHGEHRHHLGGGGDVEAALTRERPVLAEPDGDPAQDAVFDVETAAPGDRRRVDSELVPMQQVRVDGRREQVVRRGDRVQVAGEVEVDVLARNDLCEPRPGAAALCAQGRPDGRLAEAHEGAFADVAETFRERDRRRRLAFAALRRRDRRNGDQLPVGTRGEALEHAEADLRLVAAEELDLVGIEVETRRDLRDRTQLFGLRVDSSVHRHNSTMLLCGRSRHQCRP